MKIASCFRRHDHDENNCLVGHYFEVFSYEVMIRMIRRYDDRVCIKIYSVT